jgi:hypothetical protein
MTKPILPAIVLAVAMAFAAVPGHAQTNANNMGGTGTTHTITVRAKVRSVNQTTREVTLVGPDGHVFTVHAGDQVQNLDKVKKGDTVVAKYTQSTVLVLAGPGEPVPPDTVTLSGSRAAPGQTPAASATSRVVVTGTVVGIDLTNHTLQLVNPQGGRVVTVEVTDPQRQQQMTRVAVGDRITAVLTDALAISLDPVR